MPSRWCARSIKSCSGRCNYCRSKGSQVHHHWELLEKDAGRIWKEVDDGFCADPDGFKERHYREFVTFLPFVQRILYGEGAKRPFNGRLRQVLDQGLSPDRRDNGAGRLPGAGRACGLRYQACRSLFFPGCRPRHTRRRNIRLRRSPRRGAGLPAPVWPRLSCGVDRAGRWHQLPPQGGMAGGGWTRARGVGLRGQKVVSGVGMSRAGAAACGALAISAQPHGAGSHRSAGSVAVPSPRILPHAADGVSGRRPSGAADARRFCQACLRDGARRPARAAFLPGISGALRGEPLLRQIL